MFVHFAWICPFADLIACWDTPPPVDSSLYPAFERALKKYLGARQVFIPVLTPREVQRREEEATHMRAPPNTQPDCIVGGVSRFAQLSVSLLTLLDTHAISGAAADESWTLKLIHQMEGFQWLLFKHFKRESCILADDMGLGKT